MALEKKIKTKWMSGVESCVNAAVQARNAMDLWLIQDKIRIIGMHLDIDFDFCGAISMGQGGGRIYGEVSRVGVYEQDGVILTARVSFASAVETGGIAWVGGLIDDARVMFPEGYGIDLDPGEYLYLNGNYFMDAVSGGARAVGWKAIIFYVER